MFPFEETLRYGGGHNDEAVRNSRLLRVLRLVRLVKLLRVLRASRVLHRVEDRLVIRTGVVKLCKYFVNTLLCSHWLACLWHLVPVMNPEEPCNWFNAYFAGTPCEPPAAYVPLASRYVASLYWCGGRPAAPACACMRSPPTRCAAPGPS